MAITTAIGRHIKKIQRGGKKKEEDLKGNEEDLSSLVKD
jgi:hypothetical protein